MKLIDNWKTILTQAWSVRFGLASGACYGLDLLAQLGDVLPSLQGAIPARTFLYLSTACAVAGFLSRFIQQEKLHG